MEITWKCVTFDELNVHELYAIMQLRNEVFVVEQNCVFQDADDKDQRCWHLTGWHGNKLAAYARLVPPGVAYDEMAIGRVVSSPAMRGAGIGRQLMQNAILNCTLIFGENDLAFRFFPWLASLFSLPLFVLISKRFLSGVYLLGAVTLFSGSIAAFLYSGQAKQYSIDLMVCLFLVWSALFLLNKGLNKWMTLLLAFFGGIGILSCFPAIPLSLFLLALLGIYFYKTTTAYSKRYLIIIGCIWLMAALLNTYYSQTVIGGTVKSDMSAHWREGFPPTSNFLDYVLWFPNKILRELTFFNGWWFGEQIQVISILSLALLILSLPGIIYLVKKDLYKTLILFSPLLIALALAALRLMPFANRVSLYASFPLLICSLAGIQALREWWPRIFHPVLMTGVALLVSLPPMF